MLIYMDMLKTWSVQFVTWLWGDLIELIALVIALIALIIAAKEKHLAVTSAKSHALLFGVKNVQNIGPDSCELEVFYEARGPIPYHDLRACVWDTDKIVTQDANSQHGVFSSSDGRYLSRMKVSCIADDIRYVGLVWSEPHGDKLITLGCRAPLDFRMSQGTEYWQWTPWVEKLSLGFFSGRWKKTPQDRWMFFKRDIGPTK